MANKYQEILVMRLDHEKDKLEIVRSYKYGSSAVRKMYAEADFECKEMNEKRPWMHYKQEYAPGKIRIGHIELDDYEDEYFKAKVTYYLVGRE